MTEKEKNSTMNTYIYVGSMAEERIQQLIYIYVCWFNDWRQNSINIYVGSMFEEKIEHLKQIYMLVQCIQQLVQTYILVQCFKTR